jgi:hypothetical protein
MSCGQLKDANRLRINCATREFCGSVSREHISQSLRAASQARKESTHASAYPGWIIKLRSSLSPDPAPINEIRLNSLPKTRFARDTNSGAIPTTEPSCSQNERHRRSRSTPYACHQDHIHSGVEKMLVSESPASRCSQWGSRASTPNQSMWSKTERGFFLAP